MDLRLPDYAILAVTLGAAVCGLFVGFSGALGFLTGAVSALATGYFAWPLSADFIASAWLRGLAVGLVSLLVFGLVRWLTKKFVHGLVAQPGDALLGMLFAALAGFGVVAGIVWGAGLLMPDNPNVTSAIVEEVLVRVGR